MSDIVEQEIKDIAIKYHVYDKLDDKFFRDMCIRFLKCKKRTGRDPHEWLKHHDRDTYKNTGAIGWIDALDAIESVVDKYESFALKLRREEQERCVKIMERRIMSNIDCMEKTVVVRDIKKLLTLSYKP